MMNFRNKSNIYDIDGVGPISLKGVTSVLYLRGIGSTPARTNRRTGELHINMDVWPRLIKEHKIFVLKHEEGHIVLNTSNELEVDNYASDWYISNGYSLTQSVKALTEVLNENNDSHIQRATMQLKRAAKHDYFNNKNSGAWAVLNHTNMYNHYNLFGGKKRKAVRQEKRSTKRAMKVERKQSRQTAKVQRKSSQNEVRLAKAQGIRQGTYTPGAGFGAAVKQVNGVAGNAASIIGGIHGIPIAPPPSVDEMRPPGLPGIQSPVVSDSISSSAPGNMPLVQSRMTSMPSPEELEMNNETSSPTDQTGSNPSRKGKGKGNNKTMYIIIAVVVVLLIGFLVMRKKK
jgi:hypothetical protein